jgi:hypothetical protein
MAAAACEAGVPVHLFDALIIQESRYIPVAVSPKGATGLAQLMPASARILGVRNILDPRENMRGAISAPCLMNSGGSIWRWPPIMLAQAACGRQAGCPASLRRSTMYRTFW